MPLRALKFLVIFMGLLIVAGIVAIGWKLSQNLSAPKMQTVMLPHGATILSHAWNDKNITFHIRENNGQEYIAKINDKNSSLSKMVLIEHQK